LRSPSGSAAKASLDLLAAGLAEQSAKEALAKLRELKIRGLSKLVWCSVKAAKRLYVNFAKGFWKPSVDASPNGTLKFEGFELAFYQVEPDVNGGRGWDDGKRFYWVRGGNALERVRVVPLLDAFGRGVALLIMEFGGEEHPNPLVDKLYKGFRLAAFFKLKDVEAVVLELRRDELKVVFPSICSGSKTYASEVGAHKTCSSSHAKTRIDLYVSNVWNHAMATWNTNPSLPLLKMAPRIEVLSPSSKGLWLKVS